MFLAVVPYSLVVLLAAGGFALAFYVYSAKSKEEPLVCPIGTTCDEVVHSEFSKFLGIPVEFLGLFYYGVVAASYAVFLISPKLYDPVVLFPLLVVSMLAFLFSLYLTVIQAFFLKQWCTWCLISAGISTLIFAISGAFTSLDVAGILESHKILITIFHVFGVSLGLGGATIADFLFFRFLKDLRISEWESEVLRFISQVVWFALAVIILSGLGLYLPQATELNSSPKFLAKIMAVAILLTNGTVLNLLIAPRLVRISFGKSHKHEPGELSYLRRLAFALGGVSVSSWYSVFVLGMLPRDLNISFGQFLSVYLGFLILAVLASQLVDKIFSKKIRA